jgi:MFS family permease
MLIDISPLRRHRDFRLVFTGQLVSSFGSFLTYVALPVQLFELSRSSLLVGLLGVAQLVPLALTSLWGGAYADALDRRRLLLGSESLLFVGSLALAVNAMRPHPSAALVFALAALMSAVNGFHRPALESLTPRLVDTDELTSVSALTSLRSTAAAIAGPALAGLCIARFGMTATFGIDALTYLVSLAALSGIRAMPPPEEAQPAGLESIREGLRYARSRPEIIGTYVVDIVAMTFAMPSAVFPELASGFGGAGEAGLLFSAMSVGALVVTVFSGWTRGVTRHGAAVIVAAALWGVAIFGLGSAPSLPAALLCLACAGAADMVSGIFRMTIWNETIPTSLRGRLAGIEQLGYMSGPLLGNARAGLMVQGLGLRPSIAVGGALCVVGVITCVPLLPAFWGYRRAEAAGPAVAGD